MKNKAFKQPKVIRKGSFFILTKNQYLGRVLYYPIERVNQNKARLKE